MKLIIGLGNPGQYYEKSRHNAGFMAIDEIASKLGAKFSAAEKFKTEVASLELNGQKVFLAKPITFMNESGSAVQMLSSFYKIKPEDIVLIHDEIDLPLGTYRLSNDSGSAGHKGVESVIEKLGTKQFPRARVGISNPKTKGAKPTETYVLENFLPEEIKILNPLLLKLRDEIIKQLEA